MSIPPNRRKTATGSLRRIAKRLRIPFRTGDKTMALTSNEAAKTPKTTTTTTTVKKAKKKSGKK
jgi:hypothetical protein